MTLGDAIAGALPSLRAHAESMMRDAVKIERATGATMVDPVTLGEVPVVSAVYAGKARIQRTGSVAASEPVVGENEFTVDTFLTQLPLSASGILPGDVVTVTAVDALTDPDLLDLVGTVRTDQTKSQPTKRTLVCEQVS